MATLHVDDPATAATVRGRVRSMKEIDMQEATCAVPACDRSAKSRGLCPAHHKRWLRTGNPGTSAIVNRRTGCIVDGCDRKHFGHGYCQIHLYRWRQNGDPLVTRPPGSPAGESNPHHLGTNVSYGGVHARLRRQHGPASGYDCIKCGASAADWAYQHDDPDDEQICPKVGLPFTTDLTCYRPMCTSCHIKMDAAHGQRASEYYGKGTSQIRSTKRWRAYATKDGQQFHGGVYSNQAEAFRAAAELRARLRSGNEWELADH